MGSSGACCPELEARSDEGILSRREAAASARRASPGADETEAGGAGSSARRVLVTGVTGARGDALARRLCARGEVRTRGLTQDPTTPAARRLARCEVETVPGGFESELSLLQAMEGVDAVVSLQPFLADRPEKTTEWGGRVVDAARIAGVRHLVYVSSAGAGGYPPFDVRQEIDRYLSCRSADLAWTVLRPVFPMEAWLEPSRREEIRSGRLRLPLPPDRELQQAAPGDVAAVAERALVDPEAWDGRRVEVVSEERSPREVARACSHVLGRTVRYEQTSWEEVEGRWLEPTVRAFRWIADRGFDADPRATERIVGELTSLPAFLERSWEMAA